MSRIYHCPHCGARNTMGGQCTKCLKQLGSLIVAAAVAPLAALAIALAWGLLSWLTRWQALPLALIFGAVVSAVVASYSGGRGILFQAIATFWTIVGIAAGDTLAIYLLWDHLWPAFAGQQPDFRVLMLDLMLYDGATVAFMTLGVMGGFWLWRNPERRSGI